MKECYYYYILLQMQSVIRLFFISITKKNNLEVKKFITTLVSIKHVLAISICKACTINDRRRTNFFLDSYNRDSLIIINFSTTEYEAYCIIYKFD